MQLNRVLIPYHYNIAGPGRIGPIHSKNLPAGVWFNEALKNDWRFRAVSCIFGGLSHIYVVAILTERYPKKC